jgi:hypothetical protein
MSRSVPQLVCQNGRYLEVPPPKQKEKKEKRNYFTELTYRQIPPPPLRPAPELPQNKRRVHKGDLVWVCLGGFIFSLFFFLLPLSSSSVPLPFIPSQVVAWDMER